MNDEILNQFEAVAAKQAAVHAAEEEAESTLAEFGDLAEKQALYFNLLIERGLPAKIAQESVIALAGNYWDHRFRDQFRTPR